MPPPGTSVLPPAECSRLSDQVTSRAASSKQATNFTRTCEVCQCPFLHNHYGHCVYSEYQNKEEKQCVAHQDAGRMHRPYEICKWPARFKRAADFLRTASEKADRAKLANGDVDVAGKTSLPITHAAV